MGERLNVVGDGGRSQADAGYDHGWFGFSPLPSRPRMTWPGGARVAVSVVLDLRAVEWEAPDDAPAVPPVGGRGLSAPPDYPRMSHREFGHRVGIFRLLDLLAELGIRPAVVVDVLTAEGYGTLVDHVVIAAQEVIAGGLSGSRPLTGGMGEAEERDYIALTLDRLERRLGSRPVGWLSPEHSESARTPGLLDEVGVRYVGDWANDEQPYPMRGGAIWSFPLSWELSDVAAAQLRQVEPDVYARSLVEAFDVLHAEGERSGRTLALHLSAWSAGQAFRAPSISSALAHMRAASDVWWATPSEIVEWCRRGGAGA